MAGRDEKLSKLSNMDDVILQGSTWELGLSTGGRGGGQARPWNHPCRRANCCLHTALPVDQYHYMVKFETRNLT